MGRGRKLTYLEMEKIQFYMDQKLSNREIAKRIGRSPKVVNNYIKHKENYGKNYKGRTKLATSSRERRLILRAASNSSKTVRQIANDVNTSASLSTVRRIIKSSSYLKRNKMRKKPLLRDSHKEARLSFARIHMSWTDQWNNVVFSDEKKFNLDGPDGYSYYFHDLRKEEIILSRRHSGGGSVMVWGAISYYGIINISIIKGKQTSTSYIKLLEEKIKEIRKVFKSKKWIFQKDNAPSHASHETKTWFQLNKIQVLDWPSNSPDLNIIENVWGYLSRQLFAGGRTFSSSAELIQEINYIWNNLDQNYIRSLYKSIPNRIFDVIQSNGKYTKY